MKIQTLFLCLLTVGILACGKDDPVNNENGNEIAMLMVAMMVTLIIPEGILTRQKM